jgi:hypothetical protein
MKKLFRKSLLLSLFIISFNNMIHAQQWEGPSTVTGTIVRYGDTRVGQLNWSGSQLRNDQGGSIELGGVDNVPANGSPYIDFHSQNTPNQDFNVRLINDRDKLLSLIGKLYIGYNSSQILRAPGYSLYADGGIITTRVRVANVEKWFDHVFESNYTLRPISELEAFIKEHKHLPEIPSATEVKNEGIDLEEMNGKLLQKVEELTLYMIEQQKLINLQQQELEKLKSKVTNLENSK